LLLTIFMIIHTEYVKPALTRGLMAHDCRGPQFVEDHGQVPTLPPLNPALGAILRVHPIRGKLHIQSHAHREVAEVA